MIPQQGKSIHKKVDHSMEPKNSIGLFTRFSSKIGILLLNSLSRLPFPLLYLFSDFLYLLIYKGVGYRKSVVQKNLRNAYPDKSAEALKTIEIAYYKYLSSIMVEIFKMRTLSEKELNRRVKFKNIELVSKHLDQGQSILICSPHYGNWEWSVLAMALHVQAHIYTIYKPLSNPLFDKWFYQTRNRYGNTMVPMRHTLRAIKNTENETSIFCFANDQAPPKEESHHWVDFLNQPTSFHLGVEKIAQKTKRPVFYAAMKTIKKGFYEIEFAVISLKPEQSEPLEITKTYARKLEETLNEAPPYWLWSHKRWKHQPETGTTQNPNLYKPIPRDFESSIYSLPEKR